MSRMDLVFRAFILACCVVSASSQPMYGLVPVAKSCSEADLIVGCTRWKNVRDISSRESCREACPACLGIEYVCSDFKVAVNETDNVPAYSCRCYKGSLGQCGSSGEGLWGIVCIDPSLNRGAALRPLSTLGMLSALLVMTLSLRALQ